VGHPAVAGEGGELLDLGGIEGFGELD